MEFTKNIRGRSISQNVIPTVCNLKNTLTHLSENEWKTEQLSDWDKRTYKAYRIEEIIPELQTTPKEFWPNLMRVHILGMKSEKIGSNCADIYLVCYVSETMGIGKALFFNYILSSGISNKENSAQAIWQVGKGDGEYLNVLNEDGSMKDPHFFERWING